MDGEAEGRERGEIGGRPGSIASIACYAEGVEGLLRGVDVPRLLVVVEDAGERIESFGAVGVGGELFAGRGDKGALAVSLVEQGEVGLD